MIGPLGIVCKYWFDAFCKFERGTMFDNDAGFWFNSIIFQALNWIFRNDHIRDFLLPDENITYQLDSLVFKSLRWNLSTYVYLFKVSENTFFDKCLLEYHHMFPWIRTPQSVCTCKFIFETFCQFVIKPHVLSAVRARTLVNLTKHVTFDKNDYCLD